MMHRAKQLLGVLLHDMPRYWPALRRAGGDWRAIRNRDEMLEPAPDGSGYRCLWSWTSDLHAPKLLPSLGLRLMRRALAEHPVERAAAPRGGDPQVSFVIGHRGAERAPLLLATLESIAAQRHAGVECIVVEQDDAPDLRLPAWVRHVRTAPPDAGMPYCRSWAFNVGARLARAPVLVLHDNDMLVPVDYAAQVCERVAQGFDVVNLKRFIFYLDESHTRDVLQGHAGLHDRPPAAIVQNLEGGGSIAITRAAYDAIGGMDEAFVGWGGEDNEFWERALLRRAWLWAGLPIVHLFHPPQAGKSSHEAEGSMRYAALREQAPELRAARLRETPRGGDAAPHGWRDRAAVAPGT